VETEQAMANDTVACEMDECLQTDSVYNIMDIKHLQH
jgi:hypothetical protein